MARATRKSTVVAFQEPERAAAAMATRADARQKEHLGPIERNKTLSEQRAESVKQWLVDHGVSPDRLVAAGYGQSKPLVPNVTAANKARNRRVQFVILEQDPAAATAAPATPASPGTRK
jgi:hypothetical protein